VVPGVHLDAEQRSVIGVLARRGCSCREIAGQVGVSHSTVSRELRRDGASRDTYRAWTAQLDADVRRRRPKPFRLQREPQLREQVAGLLRARCSPQQVTGRLRRLHPDQPELHVSHTTIYRAIYLLGRAKLLTELDVELRRKGKVRRPRSDSHGYSRIKDAVSIHDRPAEVQDRRVPGHWEGDLLKGKANASAIATLVERTTRFTILVPLPAGWKSTVLAEALADAVHDLPTHLKRSLTWDRGTEMAAHATFTIATDIAVYFADPHSPWQRPSNENTNGLIRQYLPKGTDLHAVSATKLREIQNEINARPRKIIEFATPAEALDELIAKAGTTDGATTP
jgi:IS30 family transposase